MKLGIVEVIVVGFASVVLFSKLNLNLNIKNIVLTTTTLIVGIFLAVFGQIYQTGANAYDLFLGWTLLVTLWVIVSNYPPLLLVYLILCNTTFVLYREQIASDWSELFIFNMLFLINGFF